MLSSSTVRDIESFGIYFATNFQKTPIKPGKTRKFAFTPAFSGLRYALDTKTPSDLERGLSPNSALRPAINAQQRAAFSVERD
jgi:hypothetical protein